MGWQTG